MNKPTLLLIDADTLIFKAGFSNEKSDGEVRVANPPQFAFKTCKDLIRKWLEKTGCTDFLLIMSDKSKPNFRYEVAKTLPYKGNRKDSNRPILEGAIGDYLKSNFSSQIHFVRGIEVDDGLGILQDKVNGTTCIASNDKDLDQIPGWHFDPDVGTSRRTRYGTVTKLKMYKGTNMYYVTDPGFVALREHNGKRYLTGAGKLWFCAQMLKGDKVDNIPGLPKYGDVNTYKALKDCNTTDEALKKVISLYREVFKDFTKEEQDDRIKEMATLLWIKREIKEKIFPKKYLE